MADEVVQPEDVSKDMLQELFESAYMETSFDSDGDLRVKETYSFWVLPHNEGKQIRLMSQFRAKPESSLSDRLSFVNTVNEELVVIRASMDEDGDFGFDYYIPVDGGITKRAIVMAAKFFAALIEAAVRKDEKEVVA